MLYSYDPTNTRPSNSTYSHSSSSPQNWSKVLSRTHASILPPPPCCCPQQPTPPSTFLWDRHIHCGWSLENVRYLTAAPCLCSTGAKSSWTANLCLAGALHHGTSKVVNLRKLAQRSVLTHRVLRSLRHCVLSTSRPSPRAPAPPEGFGSSRVDAKSPLTFSRELRFFLPSANVPGCIYTSLLSSINLN